MARLQPTVFEGIELEGFIQHFLNSHGPCSTIVVCTSREGFTRELHTAISQSEKNQEAKQRRDPDLNATEHGIEGPSPARPQQMRPHSWTTPTLRLLASAQTLRLAFCEDVTHLRAYLAAYPHRSADPEMPNDGLQSKRTLAILNPIALHRPTSNFSAQGLNRTFSVAVDAAHASRSKLVIAECQAATSQSLDDQRETGETVAGLPREGHGTWDEEVSILNVATKTFGVGERGWVGRTVKLRAVASRWCVFESWHTNTAERDDEV